MPGALVSGLGSLVLGLRAKKKVQRSKNQDQGSRIKNQDQRVRQDCLPAAPFAPPSCSHTYSLAVIFLILTPPFVVIALTVGPPEPRFTAICFEILP